MRSKSQVLVATSSGNEDTNYMLRCFFAIPLPPSLYKQLDQVSQVLRSTLEHNCRWIKGENMHLTLRFLGDINPGQLANIIKYTQEKLQNFPAFPLDFTKLHAFPHARHPHIIALSCDNTPELLDLVKILESAALHIGLSPNKLPFRGHISLARIKKQPQFPLPEKLVSYPLAVDQITLMKSDIDHSGAHYSVLEEFSLVIG